MTKDVFYGNRKLDWIAFLVISFSVINSVNAQTVTSGGGTGNWNDPLSWTPNTVPTASTTTSITINHPITVTDAGRNGDQMVINSGGSLTINSGITFTVNAGSGDDLTINSGGIVNINSTGTLQIQNSAVPPPPRVALIRVFGTVNNAGSISNATSSTLIFGASSTYNHLFTSTAGAIPSASWNTTSNCRVTGYTTNSAAPTGLNQVFGNFVWDTPSLSGFIDLDGTLNNVTGDLIFRNVPSSYVYLTSTTDYSLTIGGNFEIDNSHMGLNSTASVVISVGGNVLFSNNSDLNPTFDGNTSIDVEGDFEISGGTINLTYGGAGNIPINVGGDFTLSSSPVINNGGSGTYLLTFDGVGTQNYQASQEFTDYSFLILNGSRVDVANGSFFSGPGSLTIQAGATLGVADLNGLATGNSTGNIRVSGTRTYTANSNIIYNGNVAQDLGNEWGGSGALNGVAVNLEIANTSGTGVTNNIIGSTSLVGNLTLSSGALNIGNSNTLQIQSNFNGNGGELGGLSSSNLTFSGSGSVTGLLSFASGARNLNNFTIDRAGDINLGSDLTIAGTLAFASSGNLNFDQFNGQTVTINGDITQGGSGGLISGTSFTSNLIIGGTGALTALPFCSTCGSMQLNNLTLGRTGSGTYTWNSAVTILNAVNMNSGTLTHSSGLTMGAGSTFNRSSGTSISSSPLNGGAYNVSYSGTLTTGPELPTSSTDLNNLVVGGDVTLNKDITVNGTLTFSSGTFNAGSQIIDLKGNLVSNASSTLTGSDFTFSGTSIISGISAPVFGDVTVTGTLTPSANFNINGNLVNNGTLNAGSATVTFGGTTSISGSSAHNFNNVAITGTLNAPVNMNVSGNWNNTGTFNAGIASNSVTFNGTTSFTGNGLTQFSSVIIAPSSTLNSRPVLPLRVAGNFTNNGTFVASTGTLLLNGTSAQSIAGTTNTTFNNITVTNNANPLSVQVQSNQNIRGILTLSTNTIFDADGSGNTSIFTLLSTADGPSVSDAAIATLPTGAQVTGNVTVQRYMSIEGGNNSPSFNNGRIYRYISSPVASAPVSQIQVFNPVTGTFTGTSTCSGCATTQSMFLYNESVITDTNGSGTPDFNDGFEDFPLNTNTEVLNSGRGYAMFVWGNVPPVSTAGNALWSVRNPINSGTIDFVASAGVSFTAGNGLVDDGWNLVGNPYPSTIDWDAAGWTKTGLTNTIYMKDNGAASGTYASYVGGVGGTNGGSRYIPIGQAFWVKATSAPTFTATEAVKAPGNTATFFKSSPPSDLLRVALISGNKRDEVLVYFDEDATEEYDDELDAYKLKNDIFNLSTLTPEGIKLAINGMPLLQCSKTVGLRITDVTSGSYHIDFTQFESFSTPVDILLKDKKLGTQVNVKDSPTYEFQINASDETSYKDRFELKLINLTIDPNLNITEIKNGMSCNEGSVTLNVDGAPVGGSYRWYETDDDNFAIDGQNNAEFVTPPLTKSKTYFASVVSADGCEGERVPVIAQVVNFDDVTITDLGNGTLASSFEDGNQWYKDDQPIPGATLKIFSPPSSGVYKVEVTIGECKTSAERSFTVTDVEDDLSGLLTVYPNPVEGLLSIEITGYTNTAPRIVDMMGRLVGTINLTVDGSRSVGRFDFRAHSPGVYVLQVATDKGVILNKRINKK